MTRLSWTTWREGEKEQRGSGAADRRPRVQNGVRNQKYLDYLGKSLWRKGKVGEFRVEGRIFKSHPVTDGNLGGMLGKPSSQVQL